MSDDPLSKFFQKPEDLRKETVEHLARLLDPFVRYIDPDTGAVHFKPAFGKLNSKQKVVVFLLARLALSTAHPGWSAAVSPKEIETSTELPGGTIRPKLTELVRDRIVVQDGDGKYLVRPLAIDRTEAVLEDAIIKLNGG